MELKSRLGPSLCALGAHTAAAAVYHTGQNACTGT